MTFANKCIGGIGTLNVKYYALDPRVAEFSHYIFYRD